MRKYRFLVLELGMSQACVPEDIKTRCELTFGPAGRKMRDKEIIEQIEGHDAVFFSSRDHLTRPMLTAGKGLALAIKFGARPTNIDYQAASDLGVTIGWTPGANAHAVAEFTVFLTMSALRRVGLGLASMEKGEWRSPAHIGRDLRDATIGLIGFGAIGQIANRLFLNMEARTLVCDPNIPHDLILRNGGEPVDFPTLLMRSDAVSLHCDLNETSRHMLNDATLAQLKEGAVVINTARGDLIDERALCRALENGKVAAAALDVYSEEPPAMHNCLRSFDEVVRTPHIAARSLQALQNERFWALRGAISLLDGKTPNKLELLAPQQ